jgi:hypothetical protein
MNASTATLRARDLQNLLNVSARSIWRWLSPNYPPSVCFGRSPRLYALIDIVPRLRATRAAGLEGGDLAALVTFDAAVRGRRSADDLWLGGDDAGARATAFLECLSDEERTRAREVGRTIRSAITAAGLTDADRLALTAMIQPGIVRYVLSGDRAELPVGQRGEESFARALWAMNPPSTIEQKDIAA